MTKHDLIWVAIRAFGIYLLVLAVIAIPSLIGSAFGLYQVYPIVHSGSADMDRVPQTVRSALGSQFVDALARLLIFSAVGIYLVRGGSWLFKILRPLDSESK